MHGGEEAGRAVERKGLVVSLEEEIRYPHKSTKCRLWFLQDRLPGYAWYVPKADGYVNVGVGGKVETLRKNGDSLKRHWDGLVERLAGESLVTGREFNPRGHSYRLRGSHTLLGNGRVYLVGDAAGLATVDMGEGIGPAIQSGILAAETILAGGEYRVDTIPRYSLPSLLGVRGRKSSARHRRRTPRPAGR
jgi:flavin-dependent dehydrogenase